MALMFLVLPLLVLALPAIHRRICGLDSDAAGGEVLLRWGQWGLFLLVGLAEGHAEGSTGWFGWVVAALGYAELAAGCAVRFVLKRLGARSPALAKLHRYLVDNPDNLYYSRYVPHPFLQYTRPRHRVPGTDNYYYGFKALTLADVPKPQGVVRIACLGASTTEDGFPELMQGDLDRAGSTRKFQVLNFGITWWSSIHSLVNYILNVIDFRPDYLVVEENCNDHQYRGFPGLRGDAAHAYRPFIVPPTIGEAFFKFSVLFRIVRTALSWLIPSVFRKTPTMAEIGLQPGKTFQYAPGELYIVRRNLRTLCTVAAAQGTKVCLTTMPVSLSRDFGEEHARVYRPHAEQVNQIIREVAAEQKSILVDLDAAMTGREECFRDPVHTTPEGDREMARRIAAAILSDLGLSRGDAAP